MVIVYILKSHGGMLKSCDVLIVFVTYKASY